MSSLMTMTLQNARAGRSAVGSDHFLLELRQGPGGHTGFAGRFADGLPATGIQRDPLRQAGLTIGFFPFSRHQNRGLLVVR